MSKIVIITRSSKWVFDEETKTYTRDPLEQGGTHSRTEYGPNPTRYETLTLYHSGPGLFSVSHEPGGPPPLWGVVQQVERIVRSGIHD